jgi:serine O-acetyltransferase
LALSSVRLIPHYLVYFTSKQNSLISSDLLAWKKNIALQSSPGNLGLFYLFTYLMTFRREFRNIFYARVGRKASIAWLCPGLSTLEIDCPSIGGGLFIQHGIATLISADSIGENCWINQQVTIGYSNLTDRPSIGNNVKIRAGAKLVGKVKVGDDATVGLNTVVTANVPDGATVFGVPGQIVWRNPKKV